ncbi:MAG: glycosyltransferase family 4 protein [Phycisphaerales bacterium]|nr:MAG: glycosyltransferase family 4 protein [Phycisphaerales bacterium]
MPRRIAIIIERADIALGGAERSMSEVAIALTDLGLEVDLLAAKGTTHADNVRILCSNVPGKRVTLEVFAQALRRRLRENDYDIIHSVLPLDFADVYQPRGGAYAEAVLRNAASYPNRYWRWCKRTMAFANRRRTRLLRAEQRLCQDPKGPMIAALSRYVVDQFERHYRTDPQRIALILNGVMTDQRTAPGATEQLRSQVLQRLALAEAANPVLLLFAAHNFRLKGLGSLIRALHVARQGVTERPPCLLVLGAGNVGPYRRLAQRFGVEQHVVFLGPAENVQNVLSISQVGILPTFYDPSSRFILEALAAGKPVITTAFNGAIDHFVDGRHGRVVDTPINVQALAEAITHFACTANIEKAEAAIAEDDLKARISTRRVARELSVLYESLLEKRSSA